MGQAASMCRFRGCRYKKNKANKSNSSPASGLHLRSIEEPTAIAQHQHQHNNIQNNSSSNSSSSNNHNINNINNSNSSCSNSSRMPAEQGGTGFGSDLSILGGSRVGVPLPMQNNATHPLSPQKCYDAEYARMEAWMDENQEFVQDYFIRKATRQVVDTWLVSHATSAGNDVSTGSPTHANGQNCSSRGGSGATTPVRKISAHEFERGGLLKPIVNTIDGTLTFLSIGTTQNDCSANSTITSNGSVGGVNTIGNSNNYYHHNHHHHHHPNNYHHHQTGTGGYHSYYRPQRLSRNELKQLDEKELIFELVKDICNELEVRTLCHKILQNVSILLNADRGSLFLVQGRCNGSDGPKKCLVSKLFDVCPRSTVEEMEQQEEVRVAWGTGIAGHVAESGEPVNIPDAYQDERFNCEIDSITGYRTRALLCMPIKDSSGDVIGVAQVINKLNGECFTETDEKVFASYLQFCGIGLRNAQLYEKSQLEIKRNQVLLDLARMIFEEQSTIEHMVLRILTHMQSLIQCQRVQILLVHEASKGSFSRVFDFEANDLSHEDSISRTSPYESRFPINIGITGYVATTGETVNIPNAYEDDRFDPSVDENSAFKHKSILCMAIKNSLGQIIGVIQLINKFDDLNFTKNDENFVEAFAIFCGMGIHNTHMYEKAIVAMAKQSVTLEVLSYHASATIDEAHRLRRLRVPSAAHFRLHDFKFDDIHFEDDDTLKACLRMFLDLDFVERFHIDYEVLCRWLLSVKKNYRNVTYHNWRHAFNVAQMMFAILTATQWWKIFGEIECLALIIGCLCHDLDHRGTNNSFQIKASSPLAQLYSTSTMEHHHFDQCLMILNSPGNQILANLSSEDYYRVIRVLEDAILSTDLAVYFRKRGQFLQSVQEQPVSFWIADEPRALLRAMSMTVCDLSAITKPWNIEKRVADLVSSEFFEQGDMEKQELNITPIDIMNREKEDELPMMQVGFIESICLPIYEAFAQLSDKLEPLVEGVRDNRQHWIEMAQEVQNKKQINNTVATENLINETNLNGKCISDDEIVIGIASGNVSDSDAEVQIATANVKCNSVDVSNDDSRVYKNKQEDKSKVEKVNDEDGIVADDDDSELDEHHSNDDCHSSASSRIATPPPTCEDDSSPTSPVKVVAAAAAQLIVANLTNLNHKPLKQHGGGNICKSCDYFRNSSGCSSNNNKNHIRKTSSLKGANELQQHHQQHQQQQPNGCYCCQCKSHQSKSTPSMSNCGTIGVQNHQQQQQQLQQEQQEHNQYPHHHKHHHHHHHHHHNHNNNHHHNHHGGGGGGGGGVGGGNGNISGSGQTTNASESDKIPKIVGKLGNLDSIQYYASASDPIHNPVVANGIAFTATPNGHLNYLPANLLPRRHSVTNGSTTTIPSPAGGTNVAPASAVALTATATSPPPLPPMLQQMTTICDK